MRSLLTLILLSPALTFAADFKDLKAGVAFRLSKDVVVYDLDSARHLFGKTRPTKWTELDEESPVAIAGWGLKRVTLAAGTEGVMMKDAYVKLISRNRNYADCMVVFQVGERHFVLRNSDSTMSDDLNALTNLVRAFPALALLPAPGAVANLQDPR